MLSNMKIDYKSILQVNNMDFVWNKLVDIIGLHMKHI